MATVAGRGTSLVGCVLLVVGCAFGSEPPAEHTLSQADFSAAGGCADAFLYATTADETLALTVNWTEAATRAQAEGEWREHVSLPHPDVRMVLQFGRFLADGYCTDVVMPDRPQILAELPPTAGELELSVVAEPGAEPFMPLGRADLVLRDAVFEVPTRDGVEIWRIDLVELRDVEVGWFPG
jgi:hypothetical protein